MPPCPWSRRDFLRSGLVLAAGVTTGGRPQMPGGRRVESTRWALLADTHIAADLDDHYRGFYPYPNLQEIAAAIACDLPDGLVINGDLIRSKGRSPAYENFKTVLTPLAQRRPICLGLGNHDDREDFSRAFAAGGVEGRSVEDKRVIVVEAGPVWLIVLDSLLSPGTVRGRLGEPQRAWLETTLRRCDDRPAILFLHHPPDSRLSDARPFRALIEPLHQVKAVVYGHAHRYRFSRCKGIHLIGLPATGYNLSGNEAVGWVEACLTRQGGTFVLHAIRGSRQADGRTRELGWRA
jgi:Icc protein